MGEIMSVLKHPVIYDAISSDSCPPLEDFSFEFTDDEFIVGKTDKVIGLMIFHPNDNRWFCHIQVLPDFREHAMEFCKKSIDWFFETHDENRLYAKIPELYPNVSRFAEKNGFVKDSVLSDTYIKNGVSYNRILYRRDH
jgi:RimJ/RimL family protein N-acetyltransferase